MRDYAGVSYSASESTRQSTLSFIPRESFLHHFCSSRCTFFSEECAYTFVSIYVCVWGTRLPQIQVLLKTYSPGGSHTITLPLGSSEIPNFISVFVLLIFIKACWTLFKRTNSACCFYRDTITRRVALLGSERSIYPHRRTVIPHQILNLVFCVHHMDMMELGKVEHSTVCTY